MHFTKLQGAGNDFILLDQRALGLPLETVPDLARHVCQRGTSLGADGLILLDAPAAGGDVQMRFYNADGSIAEMCGNGARCIARFAYETGAAGEKMCIETLSGPVFAARQSQRSYQIKLQNPSILRLHVAVHVAGQSCDCAYVELGSPGVPHAVMAYPNLAEAPREALTELGRALRYAAAFPKGANVNFYDMLGDESAVVRSYERGVEDLTLACGTGAASVAAALLARGETRRSVLHLHMLGGILDIEVQRAGEEVAAIFLTGDTNWVAEGDLTDEDMPHMGQD